MIRVVKSKEYTKLFDKKRKKKPINNNIRSYFVSEPRTLASEIQSPLGGEKRAKEDTISVSSWSFTC